MNINSLLRDNVNVQIVISALELREAFLQWAEEAAPKDTTKEEKYLTAKEVAARLKVDPSTLWRWNGTGYLRKIKVGGRPMYKESDIKKLIEG